MTGAEAVIALLGVHFIADFVLQSDWMATNKSRRWDALALHVAVYAACFAWMGWRFVAVTFAAHFVTDAVTSRITSRLWVAGSRHWFFVVVGLDQWLHATQLILTSQFMQ